MQSLQLSKVVISILLLLTYSFGFAHNLVPHCNDTVEENHTHSTHSTHSTHKHHQHIQIPTKTNKQIQQTMKINKKINH